jgi:hypothetical protein
LLFFFPSKNESGKCLGFPLFSVSHMLGSFRVSYAILVLTISLFTDCIRSIVM